MIDFSGYLSSDIRFIVEDYRGPEEGDGYEFEMNRNDLDLRLGITPNEKVLVVIDSRLRFFGFNNANELGDLAPRSNVDPFEVMLDEAYVAVRGLFWEGLDLRVGRMVQNWGTADQFNPTDNINARDFSDQLDYSSKVPNQMIELSLYPTDWMSLTFVWIPVFKPSQAPPSATLGFMVQNDANGCFESAPPPPMAPSKVQDLGKLFGAIDACSLHFLQPEMPLLLPDLAIENSQAAARARFMLENLDFSFSYYYGRFSFPVGYTAVADVSASTENPGDFDVLYTVELYYPRMHVAGFDFSYSAEWFFDLGIVGEVAVIFPEEVIFGIQAYTAGTRVVNDSDVNIPSTPFPKATVGLDYTFTSWLYVNAMYVRGFFDEFNDRYGIHNYVVSAIEFKFLENELVIRLAGVLNVDDLSAVTYPEFTWIVVPSVELKTGVLWFWGDTEIEDPYDYGSKSKFGHPQNGRNVAFLKAKVTW